MTVLTEQEKIDGRRFRDEVSQWLRQQWEAEQPYYQAPTYLAVIRHLCPALGYKSVSLTLQEQYVLSPQKRVGFVYRRGKCPKCRRVALSKEGRIVDAYERPAMGRVVQWGAEGFGRVAEDSDVQQAGSVDLVGHEEVVEAD